MWLSFEEKVEKCELKYKGLYVEGVSVDVSFSEESSYV